MRRSSIGSPLHSYIPPDFHDDDPFDAGGDVEMDAEIEDSGLRSKQQATSRQANTADRESDDDHDDHVSRAQSKGKARMETQEEDDVVEEEISRGLGDVEMQEDEDEEVVEPPPKKLPKEKKPRKKRALAEVPCKRTPTAMRKTLNLTPCSIPWGKHDWYPKGQATSLRTTRVVAVREGSLWATRPGQSDLRSYD